MKSSSKKDKSAQRDKGQRSIASFFYRPPTQPKQATAQTDSLPAQKHTPLELQVVELKRAYPGVLLIIEVGYKMRFFGEDAETAARECNIFCYPDRNFMTASIPVPRLHVYVRRLVEAGYKVGVVRQTETAALKAAGSNRYTPFTRKLTALYTRSTLEAGLLDDVGETELAQRSGPGADAWSNAQLSNYLVCIVEQPAAGHGGDGSVEIGLAAVETSTGDVLYAEFRDSMMRSELEARLMYAAPRELLLAGPLSSASEKMLASYTGQTKGLRAETVSRDKYSGGGGLAAITAFYGATGSKEEAGALDAVLQLPTLVVQALAHALDYLTPFGLEAILRLGAAFRPFNAVHEMSLSPNALRQLEVLRNSDDGSERGSLLWLLDHTKTAFGGRALRYWVAHPLRHLDRIRERLDAVEELVAAASTAQLEDEPGPLLSINKTLAGLPDLERGITRILHRTASPAEFVTMLRALASIAVNCRLQLGEGDAADHAPGVQSPLLQRLLQAAASRQVAAAARAMLAVVDEGAAMAGDKLGLFRSEARFPHVFACRAELAACEAGLQGQLPLLRKRLRLPRLEFVSITNQADYLIEVPAERTDVPKDWQKICSTKKVHRYHPPEVKAALSALELAKERLQAACAAAWEDFLADFAQHYAPFRVAVQALAALDVLLAFAQVSCNPGYVRPEFVEDEAEPQLQVTSGRHPVLDVALEGAVVPNDTHLAHSGQRAIIVTGPNMGGKSCYIRQAALMAIMAQVGCLVPAEAVRLHVMDAIYTRMGASDNLAMGRSTFLEELTEASEILTHATPRSLVIIDELGRGTSTHDGLAIAIASLHHLVSQTRCLTLFVTHYPKVASLQQEFPGKSHDPGA
ncbi:hypothetical protein WJX72_003290 [[Myrmecia] bisecta]|uniref:DNA mismatch repair protein MSH3 n=1 Tax=[Myrmecia] bisecta TaxID=41462 RepID=A0AAW1PPK0_9CHLO